MAEYQLMDYYTNEEHMLGAVVVVDESNRDRTTEILPLRGTYVLWFDPELFAWMVEPEPRLAWVDGKWAIRETE